MPSRSRSRSRSPSRDHSRQKSWERPTKRSRSRSRERSSNRRSSRSQSKDRSRRLSRSPSPKRKPIISTNTNDPELLKSRVFAGNIPPEMSRTEFEEWFSKHGQVLAVSMHQGYGFIQYRTEEEGRRAVEFENGSLFKGKRMDVKMAFEGRNKGTRYTRGSDNERGRSPPPFRDRSPVRGGYDPRDSFRRDELSLPPPYERRPLPPDPYRDDVYRRQVLDDPYRRPLHPPDDGYRREPYGLPPGPDPYRDPYPPIALPPSLPPPPTTPTDCMIYMFDRAQRAYCDMLERRLHNMGIAVDSMPFAIDMNPKGAIESCTRRGVLFVIFINDQNEVHRSITLNILIGTPQEHRNMPLDDSMNLLARSFEKYMQGRDKPGKPGDAVVPPEPSVSYMLNLLADGRQLSLEELDKVRDFIADRRSELLREKDRNKQDAVTAALPSTTPAPREDNKEQQAQLQAKILSILNPGGLPNIEEAKPKMVEAPKLQVTPQTSWPRMQMQQPLPVTLPQRMTHQHPGQQAQPKLTSNQLNLDNPNIQKALNNLIQSGPDLIRNITSASSAMPQQQQQQSLLHQQQNRARMIGPGAGGVIRGQIPPPPPSRPPGPNAMRPMVPY